MTADNPVWRYRCRDCKVVTETGREGVVECRVCGGRVERYVELPTVTVLVNPERKRLAECLRHYFEDGPGTYRTLLDYLHIDYITGMSEGWLDFNNAVYQWEQRVRERERSGR